jgi:hypothetical protein
MRKFALCAALVGLMAAPLFADPAPIRINANSEYVTVTSIDEGTRDLPGAVQLWDGLASRHGGAPGVTGYWGWGASHLGTAGSYPSWYGWMGEDMRLANTVGGLASFTNFHWVYFDSTIGPFSTTYFHSSLALWATHPNFTSPVIGTIIGGYIISSLPGATAGNPAGGWIITVTVPAFTVPQDVWMLMATNSATQVFGQTSPATPAPLAVAQTHPYIFSGDPLISPMTGSFFTLTTTYGPIMMAWALHVPEPATLLLLAGGVLALRRRK